MGCLMGILSLGWCVCFLGVGEGGGLVRFEIVEQPACTGDLLLALFRCSPVTLYTNKTVKLQQVENISGKEEMAGQPMPYAPNYNYRNQAHRGVDGFQG